MLWTIELMLGLKPMTHYDDDATPMVAPFREKPDSSPYVAEKRSQALTKAQLLKELGYAAFAGHYIDSITRISG